MSWLSRRLIPQNRSSEAPPPAWAPATEASRTWGLKNEAPLEDFEAAERFCRRYPSEPARFLPSYDVDRIRSEGYKAWGFVTPSQKRFKGTIKDIRGSAEGDSKIVEITSTADCGDTCILSNFPIMGGLYDCGEKAGVYFEVTVLQMEGVIAIGTACRPYPDFRLPGWNRLSAGLHLDDMQKFWEDPCGGRSYDARLTTIKDGDVIGCGYDFTAKALFYTFNGERLVDAFRGVYTPREKHDVYAAVGVAGPGANRLRVNFGGAGPDEAGLFRWKPGQEKAWHVEGHVGYLAGYVPEGEALPSYSQAV